MIKTLVLKHLPGAREGERGGRKENVRGGATAREAVGMGRYVWVIEGEEVRRNDPVEYFLLTGVGKYLLSARGGDGN